MITTMAMSFSQSFMASLLGILIVFLSLVFLALFVTVVSKVIGVLESSVLKQPAKNQPARVAAAAPKPTVVSEAVPIAVIAAALTEERREPAGKFVITNIKKI